MKYRFTGPAPGYTIDLTDDDDSSEVARTLSASDADEDVVALFNPPIGLTEDDNGPEDDSLQGAAIKTEEEVVFLPFGPAIDSAEAPSGCIVKVGICVELYDGDFFLVLHLIQVPGRGIHMRGTLLRRTHRCEDMLPKKLNEVAMIIKADARRDADPKADQNLATMPLSAVMCERDLILTNMRFPQASFRELVHDYYDQYGQCIKAKAIEIGPLVCRWKLVSFYDVADKKVKKEALIQLRQSECTTGKSMPDVLIAQHWRGSPPAVGKKVDSTVNFHNCKKRVRNENDIDLTMEDDDYQMYQEVETSTTRKIRSVTKHGMTEQRSHSIFSQRFTPAPTSLLSHFSATKPNRQRPIDRTTSTVPRTTTYVYGDICAGAGGMASGAKQAGLRLKFLLDHWSDACQTLRLNFPDSKVMEKDIHDFCTNLRRSYQVDVLHVSFPCQPHSPAHTIPGSRDEENIATGYSVLPIFDICKPRIATFEQTPGIRSHRGGHHFRALIHQITAAGYSVSWRIINMAEYGNPQPRKRLIIIAAAPGEKMPPFPKPTHGFGYALKPFTTIWDILQRVPRRDDDHMHQHLRKDEAPSSPHEPLKALITCSGGDSDVHPSGKRSFTLRELALLQAFPASHRFYGLKGSIKKQIGNAVPSCFGKAMFEEIVKSLQASDREAAAYRPETIELD